MKFTLIGIDPGVKDTGLVVIRLDVEERTIGIKPHVFEDVTKIYKGTFDIKPSYLDDISQIVQNEEAENPRTYKWIEGYMPRGYNVRQDQAMTNLVDATNHTLPGSVVVDNRGVKNIVTEDTMKLFHVARFNKGTNHADLKSAARIALRGGIDRPDDVNPVLAQYMIDHLIGGMPWARVSM